MIRNTSVVPIGKQWPPMAGIDRVIDAIGSKAFSSRLAAALSDSCGVSLFGAYRICKDRASVVATGGIHDPGMALDHAHRYAGGLHWRHDPALAASGAGTEKDFAVLVHVDPLRIDDVVLKRDFYCPARIVDRLSIHMRRDDSLFVLSLLRTFDGGPYPNAAIERIAMVSELLVSLVARHATLNAGPAADCFLDSVAGIEERLLRQEACSDSWRLTNRERQVCARILFGMMAAGIAVDLGINECSVDTYRKRAYCRLGVATRHELLRWYLSLDAHPAAGMA